jgi:CBS domain containing-hemolysin-like protein
MSPIEKLIVTLLLVALNGFFVAAEFAIIRVRQTRIAELVEQGVSSARSVQSFLVRLDTYLSGTQLGVTLASLALGAVGEPAMAQLLAPLFRAVGIGKSSAEATAFSVLVGFIIITVLHIVFGELLPKWWVIAHTERTALGVARPMRLFLWLGFPLIKILESVARIVARAMKIEPSDAHAQAHSEDEILAIMAHSQRQGELRPSEIEIAENVFDFAHTQAREIMVPRVDMVALSTTSSIGENVRTAVDSGFTRYPLCEGDRDHVIGMVHIKDLLAIAGDPKSDIHSIARSILAVPETKPIDELLKELQKSHTHQAIVVDEYGGTAGLVTLEDIIEELIGEIQDEHDRPPDLQRLDEAGTRFSIAGTVAIDDLTEELGVEIENPDEFETIGGYALHQLHLPPRIGSTAHLDGYDIAVAEATGRRIRRLLVTKRAGEEPREAEHAAAES